VGFTSIRKFDDGKKEAKLDGGSMCPSKLTN
jgi:hypothetical protein